MAEKLFKQLETTTKRFEVKLMTLDVISRLIGLHDLFVFNFYPYIQRFMQPHQREVVRLLQFAAQASHELVPPDVLEPILKTLANNFITERNSSDVMAIGLNAVREICNRCPLAINEDLLRDLTEYKNYKDRSVMMAARSLIQLFRTIRPELLHRKDRGKPTEAAIEYKAKDYGAVDAKDYVQGADILLKAENTEVHINSESDSENDEEWVDVPHSSDDDGNNEEDSSDESSNDETEDVEDEDVVDEEDEKQSDKEKTPKVGKIERKILKAKRKTEDKKKKLEIAQKISLERILTDEDFKRIDMENIRKQVQPQRGPKRKLEEKSKEPSELVKLGDIENIYKKRKHDKEARIKSVRDGQTDRKEFGYKDGRMNIHCSKTNREKRKKKNYQMIKHKVQGKVKRSFKDKQIALRNHLLKMKKMR